MGVILYGECVGPCGSTEVRISELADQGCDLEVDAPASQLDGDLSLWIGAVGPFRATATPKARGRLALRFKEPLDNKILHHFGAL